MIHPLPRIHLTVLGLAALLSLGGCSLLGSARPGSTGPAPSSGTAGEPAARPAPPEQNAATVARAREHKAVFVAVGSTPEQWQVEIKRGAHPALEITVGKRSFKVQDSSVAADRQTGTVRFDGTTGSTIVALRVQRGQCLDRTLEQAFGDDAQLQLGNRTYFGCGTFLPDE